MAQDAKSVELTNQLKDSLNELLNTSHYKKGALALFSEKYDDSVRVLRLGEGCSIELCVVTYVTRIGNIGFFFSFGLNCRQILSAS
ncbi:MAG: hypothetical protein OXE99_02115 [Cellvibrionales bacterium]|nr:hypothetical protein [Cellvibrionales bacterium]